MSHRHRIALIITLTCTPALALSAGFLGWLSPPRDWQLATGWQKIPTTLRPSSSHLWTGSPSAPTLRWLGHSGFLVEWRGERLLIDPNTSSRCTVSRRVLSNSIVASDLGHITAALISHAHYDHLDLPTLAAVPTLDQIVVPTGSEHYLDDRPGTQIHSLTPGESLRVGELEIIAVPAAHHGNRFHPLASRQLALGYVLRAGDDAIYYAGDTGFGDHLEDIAGNYRPRAAILPIGAYSPRWPLAKLHLNPEEAVKAAEVLGVEAVVPCHFGTFTLSLDRPSWALPRFARAAHAAGLRWVMPMLNGGGDLPRNENVLAHRTVSLRRPSRRDAGAPGMWLLRVPLGGGKDVLAHRTVSLRRPSRRDAGAPGMWLLQVPLSDRHTGNRHTGDPKS